jgi:casein kinase 1
MSEQIIIQNKYILQELIGKGQFSSVYKGLYKRKNQEVACKMEQLNQPFMLLQHECKMLRYLYKEGCHFIPQVFWYGLHEGYRCCILPCYECDLSVYLQETTLEVQQINRLFKKMISMLEYIHSHYVLHRDLKPENFMVSNNELYLIDFGLSIFYIDEHNQHKENLAKEHLVGNRTYASYFALEGNTISRRDDLLSLGYLYFYLLHQTTPWQHPPQVNHPYELSDLRHPVNLWHKHHKSWEQIKTMDKLPNSIRKYLEYGYSLSYDKQPYYSIITNYFD